MLKYYTNIRDIINNCNNYELMKVGLRYNGKWCIFWLLIFVFEKCPC